MKKYIAIVVWIAFVSIVLAQNEEQEPSETMTGPYLGRSLSWMLGKWQGEGKRGGITFSSELEVSSILDETGLLLKRDSSGGYQEVMLLGYDMNSQKNVATLYDNRYHTGLYTCDISVNELSCSQVVSIQGYASERKYRLAMDGNLVFSIETKDPQKEVHKVLEVAFKKKI